MDLVAKAFVAVAQRGRGLHLVVAGPDEGSEAPAKEILHRACLLNRVTFTGPLSGPEKWAAFRDSTLFLLPSEDENFGMAALEALSMGVPVLLSPYVGLADAVTKAQAGLVLPLDPTAWAEGIQQLLTNPKAVSSMGEAGRRLAKSEFSSQPVATAMREAYERILSHLPSR